MEKVTSLLLSRACHTALSHRFYKWNKFVAFLLFSDALKGCITHWTLHFSLPHSHNALRNSSWVIQWEMWAEPNLHNKTAPTAASDGTQEPCPSNLCFAKKKPRKRGEKKSAAAGMVLSLHLQEMVMDVAQLGNWIKDGMGEWTLNFASTGLPFSCSQALSLGGTVHHSFVPSPNSSLLCPFPALDVLLVNMCFEKGELVQVFSLFLTPQILLLNTIKDWFRKYFGFMPDLSFCCRTAAV